MLKRKKDGGFTLIELMIVIAVIGILAVVLAPKMSGVKDSAKATQVTTNAKSVEAFIVANIDNWKKQNANSEKVETAIKSQFVNDEAVDKLENPFNNTASVVVVSGDTSSESFAVSSPVKGTVYVVLNADANEKINYSSPVIIVGYGNTPDLIVYENKKIEAN